MSLILACFTPVQCISIFAYLQRYHREKCASLKEMKHVLVVLQFLLLPLILYLPFSTSFYLALKGFPQLAFVAASAFLRVGVTSAIEYVATSTRLKVSDFTVITALSIVDLCYETQASTLLSKADFYMTLALPPVLDAVGNVVTLVYVLVYLRGNQAQQVSQLIALAIREFVEVSTSIGVMGVFTSAWYFNKPHFFMIDVTTLKELRQGLLTSLFNFLSELVGLLIFDRVVYKVFRVSLIGLGVAFISTVGRIEFFAICAGCTMYTMFFLVYHAGSDYYFKFEWTKEENKNDPHWCDVKQQSDLSCFYK